MKAYQKARRGLLNLDRYWGDDTYGKMFGKDFLKESLSMFDKKGGGTQKWALSLGSTPIEMHMSRGFNYERAVANIDKYIEKNNLDPDNTEDLKKAIIKASVGGSWDTAQLTSLADNRKLTLWDLKKIVATSSTDSGLSQMNKGSQKIIGEYESQAGNRLFDFNTPRREEFLSEKTVQLDARGEARKQGKNYIASDKNDILPLGNPVGNNFQYNDFFMEDN